ARWRSRWPTASRPAWSGSTRWPAMSCSPAIPTTTRRGPTCFDGWGARPRRPQPTRRRSRSPRTQLSGPSSPAGWPRSGSRACTERVRARGLQQAGRRREHRRGRPGPRICSARARGRGGSMRAESLSWAARGAGLAVGVGFVLVIAGLVAAARDVVLLVFLAVLLGAALEPVVAAIRGRTGIGRGLAILGVYLVFLAAVVGIAVFIVPAAFVQLSAALARLPEFLNQ